MPGYNGRVVRVLVSACLAGEAVRYDGGALPCSDPLLARWTAEGRVIPFCPEVAGGLPVPRPPAEIAGSRVLTIDGRDVTAAFLAGAEEALATGVRVAVLKDHSPSCGTSAVHDGTFRGVLRPGEGVAAALLRPHGVAVFNERELERADAHIRRLEEGLQ